jgi:hypothetical protein
VVLQVEIQSHGWYTADLRRAVRHLRREILRENDFSFLVEVADQLFTGAVLEEKIAAVFLLDKLDPRCAISDEDSRGRSSSGAASGV